MSVSEARAKLPYILKRRASPALELAADVRNRLHAAREAPLPAEGLSSSSAEALAADIRAGRDSS